ncbi:Macrophage colony-stimulating factor 1 receptor [Bagarius yarrelli]|uniref:Platelet-derived growth factor receptor-like protein n=1 Tax=Bagarius yarrelli TaxID=175774 RepID=A0A556V818_BAGYA|nr:Macrophage colony-stimulating factor 1 receptor [Bagarius yarrelli]
MEPPEPLQSSSVSNLYIFIGRVTALHPPTRGADSVFRVPQDRVLVQEEDSNILLGCIPLLPGATHFTLLLAPDSAPPPDLNFTVDVNQGILIRAVMLNHSGEYVCSVRVNATRQNSPVFVVAVKKKVRFPPAMSVEVDECVRVAGETLQLTCNTNNPDHSFTTRWHHSKKQVLQEEKTRNLVGDTVYLTSVVTLSHLNESDAGNLTCISTNRVGINTATVSLRVTEKPYVSLKLMKPSGSNPTLELMEGDTLELRVEIDAYPPIQKGWWSTPKPTNSSITMQSLSTIHRRFLKMFLNFT